MAGDFSYKNLEKLRIKHEVTYAHFRFLVGRPRVYQEVPDAAKPLSISVFGCLKPFDSHHPRFIWCVGVACGPLFDASVFAFAWLES